MTARPTALASLALAALLVVPTGCAGSTPPAPAAVPTTSPTSSAPTPVPDERSERAERDLRALERREEARVGVYALDLRSGAEVAHRAGSRFAYASTIKALAAGALLERTEPADLRRVLRFTAEDLVEYSPVAEQHLDDGLTLRQAIDAAVTESDNTAGNLLFEELGGPRGVQRALRAAGDDVTRVVRDEPELNEAVPGDVRDTTTPRQLALSVREYLLDRERPRGDRRILLRAMRRATTGLALVRAVVPDGWRVADKTGSARYGTRNDVALVERPDGSRVMIAVMTTHATEDAETRDELVAEAARIALRGLRGGR